MQFREYSYQPRAARSSDLEITSPITLWIVHHSVQLPLLIGWLFFITSEPNDIVVVYNIRELKHWRRNIRTTPTGSRIATFAWTAHVRVCQSVVHVLSTTESDREFRSLENESKSTVLEAVFAGFVFIFTKLCTWTSDRTRIHHIEVCFQLLLRRYIASVSELSLLTASSIWPPRCLRRKPRKRKLQTIVDLSRLLLSRWAP